MFKQTALISFVILAAIVSTTAQNSADVVGIWRTGGMSTIGEQNTITGSTTPRNGSTFKWEFKSDGRFVSIGYMQSTMYGCTTSLFNDKQGKYSLNGSQLTLTLTKNFWRNTYSCSPPSNKERNYTLGTEVYEVRTRTDEYGKLFLCLANEKGESCYRRESE